MNTFVYFAYGSNMLTERLRARCPSAEIICTAEAHGYKICFEKEGKDGSGKATLVAGDPRVDKTIGVLFQINKSELGRLDRAEGKDKGYYRDDWFPITSTKNGNILSVSYIAEEPVKGLFPYNWYLALIVAGARQHKLLPEYIETLLGTRATQDISPAKKDYEEALEILKKAGYEAVYEEIKKSSK